MAIPQTDADRLVTQAFQDIVVNPQLIKQFRQKPERVLEKQFENIKLDGVTTEDKNELKAKTTQKIVEWDQVLPGITVEDAKSMLISTLESAGTTFKIYTWLNVILFAVGILLLITSVVSALISGKEQFSIIFGSVGVGSLLTFFFTNPLKRISNAASDQSQLRTIIFGYWSQLANFRNHILNKPAVNLEEIKSINNELQNAMKQAIGLLQKYVETTVKDTDADGEKELKELKERVAALEKK